jgi:chorismate synthase
MEFGHRYRVRLFGASHAPEVGVEVEGLPPGAPLRLEELQEMLDRRRPLGRRLGTRRAEEDRLVVDSGWEGGHVVDGKLRAHVANTDVRRSDYDAMADTPRPGHADYPARVRYGASADLSGGGIFSGRMTVGLVIAGGIALQLLRPLGVEVVSFTSAIGSVSAEAPESLSLAELARRARSNEVGAADPEAARRMEEAIGEARRAGDSLGGVVETRVTGVPVGLGEPFFDSLESVLAHLAFSIPAVKGVEFGDGFRAAVLRGSEHNDAFYYDGGRVRTRSNHSGGILGGLATGMPLRYRVALKPTSSIAREQETVNLRTGESAVLRVGGRHDPCIVPRAGVVVESTTAIGLLDLAWAGGFRA